MIRASSTSIPTFRPTRLLDVELSRPLPTLTSRDDVTGRSYRQARVLVRLHSKPLGLVNLELMAALEPRHYASSIWQALHEKINNHLREDGLPEITGIGVDGIFQQETPACMRASERLLTGAPFVSVVICTHERTDQLRACLTSLGNSSYPNYEVIVVDNASPTSKTSDLVEREFGHLTRLRYVRENRQGLSWARNCGLEHASGTYIAFTDDDVFVDPYWLTALIEGFGVAKDVACVTGLTLPAALETPAQEMFEQFGGFSKGFERRIFDLDTTPPEGRLGGPLYPYTSGRFGSGNSMAFSTAFLREVGGFNPALGAGTPTRGGEDLAAFFQVVSSGHRLVYEPMAVNFHVHRQSQEELREQMFGYGTGLTAYLTSIIGDEPKRLLNIAVRVPQGLSYLFSAKSSKNEHKSHGYPKALFMLEMKGALYGPVAYLLSRRLQRRKLKQAGEDPNYLFPRKALD